MSCVDFADEGGIGGGDLEVAAFESCIDNRSVGD